MDKAERARLREALADLEHEQWGHWTAWQMQADSPAMRERWQRQIDTPYAGLTEREQDSDREWADRVLAIVGPVLDAAIAERDAAVAVVRSWLRNYHDGIDDAATCDRLACRQAAAVVAAATERAS